MTSPTSSPEVSLYKLIQSYTNTPKAGSLTVAELKTSLQAVSEEKRSSIVKSTFRGGKTILYRAAVRGHTRLLNCLFSNVTTDTGQPLLMMQDEEGQTLLHYTSESDSAAALQHILDYASPENRQELVLMKDNEGETSLHRASVCRTEGRLRCILYTQTLENRQKLLMMKDYQGMTSLHHASRYGTADVVKCILDHTIPWNRQELLMMKDNEGETSLHRASRYGTADIVKCILDYTIPDKNRQELLMMKDNEGETSLHRASVCGTEDGVKCILDYTTPENRQELLMMKDDQEMTSLHRASTYGTADIVKCILDYTIPENRQELLMMKDNGGKTSLHRASSYETADIVKCILDYTTPENRQELLMMEDNAGKTSLHYAASGHYDVRQKVNFLLQNLTPGQQKQLIDIRDRNGQTSLDLAPPDVSKYAIRILREYQNSTTEVTHGTQNADVPQESSETTSPSTNSTLLNLDLITDSSQHLQLVPDVSAVHQLEQSQQHMQVESGGLPPSNSKVLVFPKSQTNISNHQLENTTQASSTSASFVETQTDRTFRSLPWTDFTTTTPYTNQSLLPMLYLQNPPHNPTTNWAVNSFVPSSASASQMLSGQNPLMNFDLPHPPTKRDSVTIQPHIIDTTELLSFGTASMPSTSGYIPPPVSTNLQTPFFSNHQIPRRTDISGVEGRTAGAKRDAPIDRSNQQTSGATPPQVNRYETRIEGDIIKLICNGERYFLMFPSNGTVGDFTKDALQTTGCDCIVRSTDGYKSGNSVILKSLPIPFIISVGHTETIVTSRPEQSNVPAASASKGTESEAAAQNTAIRFGRMSNADEVVELFTFVHEQVINGKSVNAALKMARKDRKTIDRFRDIYYLHVTNKDRLNELSRDWDRSRRKGALPRLVEMARSEVDWRLLEELAGQGKTTLFGGIERG